MKRLRSHQRGVLLLGATVAVVALVILALVGPIGENSSHSPYSAPNPIVHHSTHTVDVGGAPTVSADQAGSGRSFIHGQGVPATPKGDVNLGTIDPTTPLSVRVTVAPRDPAALAQMATDVSNPASPDYRHYLKAGAYARQFGPTASTLKTVARAVSAGTVTTSLSSDHLVMTVRGTASQLGTAFATSFDSYRTTSGRRAYANTRAPSLPFDAAGSVISVVGLSNLVTPHPELAKAPTSQTTSTDAHATANKGATALVAPKTAGPTPCAAATTTATNENGYTADQLASAYNFTSAYSNNDLGAGVTVAFFEQEPYRPSDITSYQSCYGTSVPVTNIAVDGGPGTGPGVGEAALDIEDVIGLAPGVHVEVYTSANSNQGGLDVYNQMVSDDTAQVISSSWGECEPDVEGTGAQQAENTIFQVAAAQGQTVLAASGDSGSEDCGVSDHNLEVDDPASQPYVTGVGGTTLSAVGAAPTTPPTETVWNNELPVDPLGAAGGGVSASWAKPAWQTVPGSAPPISCTITPGAGTTNSCRQVPDVSASADPFFGYVVRYAGTWTVIGGTSAATPLWAALVALADSGCASGSLGFMNPRLYAMGESSGAFNDITTGNNDFHNRNGGTYEAGVGYDNASGLGTPEAVSFLATSCQSAVTSPTVTLDTSTVGATTTEHIQFTTSDTGALAPGDTITLLAPAGAALPASVSSYSINGGVTVSSVNLASGPGSTSNNLATLTLAHSGIGADAPVTLVVAGAMNPTTAGNNNLGMRTTADGALANATYGLSPGPSSSSASAVAVATPSAPDDNTADLVTVALRDQFANPVSGQSVTLSVSPSSATINAVNPITDGNGDATFNVSDAVEESVTVTATSGVTTLASTPRIDFSAMRSPSLSLSTQSAGAVNVTYAASMTTSGSGPLASGSTIVALAPPGTTLPQTASNYTISAGSGTAVVASVVVVATQASATVNKATLTLGVGTALGSNDPLSLVISGAHNPTVTGSVHLSIATSSDLVPVDPTATIGPGPVVASGISVTTTQAGAPADGVTPVSAQVVVTDAYGNPISGASVSPTTTGSALASSATPTSSNGRSTFTVTDTTSQAVQIGVTVSSIASAATAPVLFSSLTGVVAQFSNTIAGANGVSLEDDSAVGNSSPGASATITTILPLGATLPSAIGAYDVFNGTTGIAQTVSSVALAKETGSTTNNQCTLTLSNATLQINNGLIVLIANVTNPARAGLGSVTQSMSGTTNGVAGTSQTIAFVADAFSPSVSTVTAVPSSVPANGHGHSTVTVTTTDSHGNPLGGQPVSLTVPAGSHALVTPTTGTTNAAGQASFFVTDTTSETTSVTATNTSAGGGTLTHTVALSFSAPTAVAGAAAAFSPDTAGATAGLHATFTTSSQGSMSSGSSGTPTVTVAVPSGTTLPTNSGSYTVSDQTSGTDVVSGLTVSGTTATLTLAGSGITAADAVSVTIKGVTIPATTGTFGGTVATSTDTVPASVNYVVTPGPVSATVSTAAAAPSSVPADGASLANISVVVRDALSNAVAGQVISLSQGSGHSSITQVTGTTGSDGQASFTVTDSTTESVAYAVKDLTQNVKLVAAPTVTFTTPPSGTSVSAFSFGLLTNRAGAVGIDTAAFTTSTSGTLASGATITLTAPSGTTLPSAPASYSVHDNSVTSSDVVSGVTVSSVWGSPNDQPNQAVITLSASTIGNGTQVTVTVAGVTNPDRASAGYTANIATSADITPAASPTYTVTYAAPVAGLPSTVSANPATVTANGSATTTVTVALVDAFGNPGAGDSVTLQPSAAGPVVSPIEAVASSAGVATFTVRDSVAQVVSFRATEGSFGTQLASQPTVTFTAGPASASVSTLAATTTSGRVDTQPVNVIATISDSLGNAISGHRVVLAAQPGAHAVITPSGGGISSANGKVSFSVIDGVAETLTLTATDTTASPVVSPAPIIVTFTAPNNLNSITVGLSPSTSQVAGLLCTYTVGFVTSSTGALGAGSTVSLIAPSGTIWPTSAAAYGVESRSGGSIAVSAVARTGATTTLTLGGGGIGNSDGVTVTVVGVRNPNVGGTNFTLSVATSIDSQQPAASSTPYDLFGPGFIDGYWLVAADGGIFNFGGADFFGSAGSIALNQPVVAMAHTPDGSGYWLVARDGGVFAYGDAQNFGSMGGQPLNRPIVSMAATPDGQGYWLVASDGGIFSFGDAAFFGSTGALTLNKPIVSMAATPDGQGYWLVASDGGIFSFGDAAFFGSTGALTLNKPIVSMAATPDGQGYWLVASDGGIFSFGDATFKGSTGSLTLNKPIVAMVTDATTGGYWLVASDGGIFSFDAPFLGSTGNLTLTRPIVDASG